jgi:glycosyltransferase involved in cell wall biosynthesis
MMSSKRLLLFSRLAFYPVHREAFVYIGEHYDVTCYVIADAPPAIPSVHQSLGSQDPSLMQIHGKLPDIRYMPQGDAAARNRWLADQLRDIHPDAIWVQEEPTSTMLFQILRHYWFNRRPRIVTAVCENIFGRGNVVKQTIKRLLWSRLNGLIAVASASTDGIRAVGMPHSVPVHNLVAGAQLPPENVTPMELPFVPQPDDFLIGYAGRIVTEKGWQVLLTALEHLPPNFKVIIAGGGDQEAELRAWMQRPELVDRVFYVGLLPKAELWRFYAALDVSVLLSLTLPHWKEQFGAVLADSMAMGVPIIGSDSGSIPEVVDGAGWIVPEGDVAALAERLKQMQQQPTTRQQMSHTGKQRFAAEFAIPAYAGKIARSLALTSGTS